MKIYRYSGQDCHIFIKAFDEIKAFEILLDKLSWEVKDTNVGVDELTLISDDSTAAGVIECINETSAF